ncbi:hypothetical protein Q604_UNBC13000G0001, partial [human gut metagenome]
NIVDYDALLLYLYQYDDISLPEFLYNSLLYQKSKLHKLHHVTGMIFAGKEALGAPNLTDETLELLHKNH